MYRITREVLRLRNNEKMHNIYDGCDTLIGMQEPSVLDHANILLDLMPPPFIISLP